MLKTFKHNRGATVRGVGTVHHEDGTTTPFELIGDVVPLSRSVVGKMIFGLAWLFPKIWGAVTHPATVRNTIANAVVDLLDAGAGAGTIELHTSGDVEVATLTFSDPAFGAAAAGTATASPITSDTNATGGTIAKFIAQDSDSNLVFSGSVTATSGGGDVELSSVAIGATDTVSLSAFDYDAPL